MDRKKPSVFILIFWYWLPVALWMGTLFFLSSRSRFQVSTDFSINFAFFKTIHMLVYAGLFFVVFRALFRTFPKKPIMNLFIWAIVISLLYAASDEIHQTFTPHREGTPRDVFIDSIGISLMFGYTKKYLSKLRFLL